MIVYMSQSIYEIDFTPQISRFEAYNCISKVASELAEIHRLCWIAGGAVRDLLLAKKPVDIDLVTNASDEEITRLFPKAVLVGQKFGVYKLPFTENERNIIIDLAMFRKEGDYLDGRRPQSIEHATPEEDAKRRDFTMNAVFYDLVNHRVVDFVDGVADISAKRLRCVGDPVRRFNEDHLRLMRFARFQAQLGFSYSLQDLAAANDLAELIDTVSGERIYEELFKVVSSQVEMAFWIQPLTQKLWQNIGGQIDASKLPLLAFLSQVELTSEQRLVLNILVVFGFQKSSVEFLKNRLKGSRDDERLAQKTCELFDLLQKKTSALDIALWLDQQRESGSLLSVLEFLSLCEGQKNLFGEVKRYLSDYAEELLTGADLVGKCEPAQTGHLLQLVRRAQFEKKIRTSSEALTFLKMQNLLTDKQ